MTAVTHDIVAKRWNLCNVLRDDGVTDHQYVTELTYLLFLKMAQETGTEDQLPAHYRWGDRYLRVLRSASKPWKAKSRCSPVAGQTQCTEPFFPARRHRAHRLGRRRERDARDARRGIGDDPRLGLALHRGRRSQERISARCGHVNR